MASAVKELPDAGGGYLTRVPCRGMAAGCFRAAGCLADLGNHLVQPRRAGKLLPARLGDDAPELIGAVRGAEVRLTPKEFELFVYMARHPNRVLGHRTLLEAVWGEASQEQPEYLRVFMGQLRKKLEPDPSNPKYLVTEPWVGYKFNPQG